MKKRILLKKSVLIGMTGFLYLILVGCQSGDQSPNQASNGGNKSSFTTSDHQHSKDCPCQCPNTGFSDQSDQSEDGGDDSTVGSGASQNAGNSTPSTSNTSPSGAGLGFVPPPPPPPPPPFLPNPTAPSAPAPTTPATAPKKPKPAPAPVAPTLEKGKPCTQDEVDAANLLIDQELEKSETNLAVLAFQKLITPKWFVDADGNCEKKPKMHFGGGQTEDATEDDFDSFEE